MRIDGRLLTAIMLSTLGVVLTYSYYRATAPKAELGDASAIALVSGFEGRHQSRRESSQFWAPVQQGDQLYPGDTIRTGDAGDMQVRFIGAHQTLDIEPDTTVVITFPGEAPTLELLQGHMTVASTGEAQGPTLQLKTDKGVVAMDKKNSVIVKEGSQAVHLENDASVVGPNSFGITWLQPKGDIDGQLNPEAPQPTLFTWAQKTNDVKVAVEWGPTRKKMDHHQFVQTAGQIKAILPLGRGFWRWSVYKGDETKPIWSSAAARVLITGVFPPAVITPANAAVLHLTDIGEPTALAWTSSERFDGYRVEVADDGQFKKVTDDRKFNMGESEMEFKPARIGQYYWRLSGHEATSGAWLTTKPRTFVVQTKQAEKTDLKWTTQTAKPLYYLGDKPTVDLAWSASNAKSVKSYRVRVAAENQSLAEAEPKPATDGKVQIPLEAAGSYVAQVDALNAEGEVIGQSEKLSFKTESVPLLRAPSSIGGPELKANSRGQVRVEWQAVADASEYSVTLTDPTGKTQTVKSATTSQVFNHLLPGTYKVRLATIDAHARVGPSSEPTSIVVSNQSAVKTIRIKKMEVK